MVKAYFPPPFYEWWVLEGGEHYVGSDKTFDFLRTYEKEHGPFAGVIGFSQGACLAAILCAQVALTRGVSTELEASMRERCVLPALQFGIVLSGFIPVDKRYTSLFAHPLHNTSTVPCFFSYGATDFKKDACVQLAKVFSDPPAVYEHGADHQPPKKSNGTYVLQELEAFLKPFH